ncbi:MAG: pitrilysin family protein [Thermodesulfobacteriota bacterium]
MDTRTVLGNGVRIVSERLAHSHSAAVGLWVDVGSRDEHDLNNGCAHFVEHMLFKGTRRRSAAQIATELDNLGGVSDAFTTRENTCFYAKVLDTHLERLLDLLLDMFGHSLFTPEEVERERQVVLQEIALVEDTPDDSIHDLFNARFFPHHPLGNPVLGSREVVASLDAKKVLDYVARSYTPERILVTAVGNIDHQELVERVAPELGALPARPQPWRRQPPGPALPSRTVYDKDLEQAHIVLGTQGRAVTSEDRYRLLLLNVLLGGNMSSRLFQEIRERQGLAYAVYSFLSSYQDAGCLGIYLGVEPAAANRALALVRQECRRLVDQAASLLELGNAKEFSKGNLFLSADSVESRMLRLAQNELYFGRQVTLEEVAAGIDAVRPEEVRDLAAELMDWPAMTTVVLGPLAEADLDWGEEGL